MSIAARIRAIAHEQGDGWTDGTEGTSCNDARDDHCSTCDLVCELILAAEQRAFTRAAEVAGLSVRGAFAFSDIEDEAKAWAK